LLWRAVSEVSGKTEAQLTAIYKRHGDAGAVAAEALPGKPDSGVTLTEVQKIFFEIAATRGPAAKSALLRQLMRAPRRSRPNILSRLSAAISVSDSKKVWWKRRSPALLNVRSIR
jgi:DNA ligase-1